MVTKGSSEEGAFEQRLRGQEGVRRDLGEEHWRQTEQSVQRSERGCLGRLRDSRQGGAEWPEGGVAVQSLQELGESRTTEPSWKLLSGDLTCSKWVLQYMQLSPLFCLWDGDGVASAARPIF